MTDDQLKRKATEGTTTHPDRLAVLYNDGRAALVLWPQATVGRSGFRTHISAHIKMYDVANPRLVGGIWTGATVWDCAMDRDGPFRRTRYRLLLERLGLTDPDGVRPRLDDRPDPV